MYRRQRLLPVGPGNGLANLGARVSASLSLVWLWHLHGNCGLTEIGLPWTIEQVGGAIEC